MTASRLKIGMTVVLACDWPEVAKKGEITGRVVGFAEGGRAKVKTDRVTFVAPSDRWWKEKQ